MKQLVVKQGMKIVVVEGDLPPNKARGSNKAHLQWSTIFAVKQKVDLIRSPALMQV